MDAIRVGEHFGTGAIKGSMRFMVQNYSGGFSLEEKMRIESDGNVGIGTTSPSEKLEVIGNIEASNGFILTDTQNTNRYKITVVNGVLTTTLIP